MALSSRIATLSLASNAEIPLRRHAKSSSSCCPVEPTSFIDGIPAHMLLDEPVPTQHATSEDIPDRQWWCLPAISQRTQGQEPLAPIRTILGHALDLPVPINLPIQDTSPFVFGTTEPNHCRAPFPGPLSLSAKPLQSQHNVAQRAHSINLSERGAADSSLRNHCSRPAYMDGHTFASPPTSLLEEIETPPTTPENGREMTMFGRYEELLSDVQITEFDEHGAKCRLCEKVIRLGPTNTYTLGPWDQHKKTCKGDRIRRGRGFDVSIVKFNVLSVVKVDISLMKDLMSFDIMEAIEERHYLMFNDLTHSSVVNLRRSVSAWASGWKVRLNQFKVKERLNPNVAFIDAAKLPVPGDPSNTPIIVYTVNDLRYRTIFARPEMNTTFIMEGKRSLSIYPSPTFAIEPSIRTLSPYWKNRLVLDEPNAFTAKEGEIVRLMMGGGGGGMGDQGTTTSSIAFVNMR
ncbi:uncharacterized protein EV420DRAFT_1648471 [Desarmillaria tabescens]|uniref:Uncharacterized protein n=1 Tax=Armillaria tabescens TaxID=1929756 RepID=A0AA39MTL2_ARMTA|nr:uncharacterized protein EV420DRAFT_1648471 [Desarmillaria tabescens]KAK0445340.1 hypothetical protein EV420DRAFT_1648471 [Desarmillaria tabescens]